MDVAWKTILEKLKVLDYQLDSLAAVLRACHTNAVIMCDRSSVEPYEQAELSYFGAYTLADNIIHLELPRTFGGLQKGLDSMIKGASDEMITVRLKDILRDVTVAEDISSKALDFYRAPSNALDEQASVGILSVVANLRIEPDQLNSIVFI